MPEKHDALTQIVTWGAWAYCIISGSIMVMFMLRAERRRNKKTDDRRGG